MQNKDIHILKIHISMHNQILIPHRNSLVDGIWNLTEITNILIRKLKKPLIFNIGSQNFSSRRLWLSYKFKLKNRLSKITTMEGKMFLMSTKNMK